MTKSPIKNIQTHFDCKGNCSSNPKNIEWEDLFHDNPNIDKFIIQIKNELKIDPMFQDIKNYENIDKSFKKDP